MIHMKLNTNNVKMSKHFFSLSFGGNKGTVTYTLSEYRTKNKDLESSLTKLSVTWDYTAPNYSRTGKNALQRTEKVVVISWFKILSQHFPEGADRNHANTVGVLAEIQSRHLQDSDQKQYCFSSLPALICC
jgi:hypothetical protein